MECGCSRRRRRRRRRCRRSRTSSRSRGGPSTCSTACSSTARCCLRWSSGSCSRTLRNSGAQFRALRRNSLSLHPSTQVRQAARRFGRRGRAVRAHVLGAAEVEAREGAHHGPDGLLLQLRDRQAGAAAGHIDRRAGERAAADARRRGRPDGGASNLHERDAARLVHHQPVRAAQFWRNSAQFGAIILTCLLPLQVLGGRLHPAAHRPPRLRPPVRHALALIRAADPLRQRDQDRRGRHLRRARPRGAPRRLGPRVERQRRRRGEALRAGGERRARVDHLPQDAQRHARLEEEDRRVQGAGLRAARRRLPGARLGERERDADI